MRISVIVPTFRRPDALRTCIHALARQRRAPNEVIIAVRRADYETPRTQEAFGVCPFPIAFVEVDVSGVVAAMNAALKRSTGDIVAITDDDAAPQPDWLERIEAHFASGHRLAGVGGQDRQPGHHGTHAVVGRVGWAGRVQGNHHLHIASRREVDVLKGVNCAFRGDLLRVVGFDDALLGAGAQVHWELALCLSLRGLGWRLVYDPAIIVDHYPAQRFDVDQRGRFAPDALTHEVANETYVLFRHLRVHGRVAYVLWTTSVGTRAAPGFLRWVRARLAADESLAARASATLRGRLLGLRLAGARKHGHPVPSQTAEAAVAPPLSGSRIT